jgi:putative ABC transport system permease protein
VRQKVWDALALMVRTEGDAAATGKRVAHTVHEVDKSIPRTEVTSVERQIWDMGAERRFEIGLLGLFSVLSLLLAAVGTYSVMAHAVGQRTREIGVRMALGARRGDVLWMVLGQGLRPALFGLVAGLGLALGLSRIISALLFGIEPTDLATYAIVCGVLLGVLALAAYAPARRATSVDPMAALREE